MNPFPPGQFSVIYADPPWEYEMYSDSGKARAPERHYDCMTQDELLAMRDDVLWATAPNSVLIMWTTWAAGNVTGKPKDFIIDALELIRAWGFQRTTGGPWIKRAGTGNPNMGMGHTLRGASELFFVATHGRPKIKNRSTRNVLMTGDWPEDPAQIESIIVDTLIRDHSRKPDEMIPLIENLFEGPYLELFARTPRPGWTVWGNEVNKFTEETT